MTTMFECTTIETFKRSINADPSRKVAGFYNPTSLKEFITSASEELREKIFSISNPSIFFEILNPLIELNTLYSPEKLPDTPSTLYALNECTDERRVTIVTTQALNLLSDVIEDPDLQSLLSEFAFFEKKTLPKSTTLNIKQPILDAKNVIANPKKLFKGYDKALKVQSSSYIKVFEGYQKLLAKFGKGFKFICKKENEEALFFETAHYFLNTFPDEITMEEIFLNRLYANILSFGYVLENRILTEFEKSKTLSKLGGSQIKIPGIRAKTENGPSSKIHIGSLSFRMIESTFELNEYEEMYEKQNNYDQLKYDELMDDEEDDKQGTIIARKNLKIKCVSATSDTASVTSASTSESSAGSDGLKAKRKHRSRGKKSKKKSASNETPADCLFHPHAWNFQHWVQGSILQ